MEGDKRDLREIAKAIEGEGVCCNCDLDNWEPERTTGHSHVCRIHKRAMMMKFRPHDMRAPNVEFRPLDAASSRPVAPGTQG